MVERKSNSDGADDFFSSQMNFDLEENKKQKKRKRRSRGGERRSKPISLREDDFQKSPPKNTKLDHRDIPLQNNQITSCPGCGSDVNEGDLVAVMDTGAYSYTMSHQFCTRPRAAEVLLNGNNSTLIRKRETIEEIFSGCDI